MASGGDIHSILHKDKIRVQQVQSGGRWFRAGVAPNLPQPDSDDDIFQNDTKSIATHFTYGNNKVNPVQQVQMDNQEIEEEDEIQLIQEKKSVQEVEEVKEVKKIILQPKDVV